MKIYDLSIELLEIDMEIKRTLEVQDDIKLDQLHQCLQLAMGWNGSHMYMFEGEKGSWGVKSGPFGDDSFDHDSNRATLAQLVKKTGERFVYLYDFGDCWNHGIEVSNPRDAEAKEKYPKLISATNQCPPEDSGGPGGYAHMLEVLKNPQDSEYEEFKDWVGDDFDPHDVDLEMLQSQMKRFASSLVKKPAKKTTKKRKSSSRGQWVWVGPNK